jgi:hypothetical protein
MVKVNSVTWLIAGLMCLCNLDLARAQDFAGIRIGDGASSVARLGQPVISNRSGPFDLMKWQFQNRNELSVTFYKAGKIVYMESDWGGLESGAKSDFPGMIFGRTTLAEIRNKFGSNGMTFEHGTQEAWVEGGMILQNAYEVGNVMMILTTKVESGDVAAFMKDNGLLADLARLVAISLCASDYARAMWGRRISYPAYKKVEWR